MNRRIANVVIKAANSGKGFEELENTHGTALSTLLDYAWDWAEEHCDQTLARRCEKAYKALTGAEGP